MSIKDGSANIGSSETPETLRSHVESAIDAPAFSPPERGRPVLWTPMRLLVSLVVMAWGLGESSLTQRFESVRLLWSDSAAGALTYQGWVKALKRGGMKLVKHAAQSLRRRMLEVFGGRLYRFGFFVLAVDGTQFALPRTAKHEKIFGTISDSGSVPQLSLTMLWQMAVGLPWDWRVGRARTSERQQFRQMIAGTPFDTLFVMDAGYAGYKLLMEIVQSGRHFLLRGSKGVQLLSELGDYKWVDGQTVHLWPKEAQRKGMPPLCLRLITLPGKGGHDRFCLLTSVCDERLLSDEQAEALYRMRWGVELCYRTMKQTMEKHKLRSGAPVQALFEIHGLVLGLMVLGFNSVKAIIAKGGDPLNFSAATALHLVRKGLRHHQQSYHWSQLLSGAVKDSYKRKRKTRKPWARKKQADPPPGPPHVRPATPDEIALARELEVMRN